MKDGLGGSEEAGHHIQAAGNPDHRAYGGSNTEHSHAAEDRADHAESFQSQGGPFLGAFLGACACRDGPGACTQPCFASPRRPRLHPPCQWDAYHCVCQLHARSTASLRATVAEIKRENIK